MTKLEIELRPKTSIPEDDLQQRGTLDYPSLGCRYNISLTVPVA